MKELHKNLEFWEKPKNKSFNLDELPPCSLKDCTNRLLISNQFKCHNCKLIFCSEHSSIYHHNCIYQQNQINLPLPEQIIHPKCSLKSCNVKMDLCNRFTCKYCENIYCATHRHDFSHSCIPKKKIIYY